MAITFTTIDVSPFLRNSTVLKQWIDATLLREKRITGDISIAFCSDSYMKEQNALYLSHKYATDILTFSYNEERIVAGDLLISIDTVKKNAKIYKTRYLPEVYRVIIHGVLHLVGYDDTTKKLKAQMTEMEDYYLAQLAKMMSSIR